MAQVYLALGSNLGDRRQQLRSALEALGARGIDIRRASSLYESEPMYELDQPRFLNAVVEAQTQLTPQELLRAAKDVERQLGRQERPRNGPREIDVDILTYEDACLDTPELTLPHPGMNDRPFVQVPLADLLCNSSKPDPSLQRIEGPEWADS